MKREEYIETLIVKDQLVNVGKDDYGQQYFFEYYNGKELVEVGCGAYNKNYKEEIENYFK